MQLRFQAMVSLGRAHYCFFNAICDAGQEFLQIFLFVFGEVEPTFCCTDWRVDCTLNTWCVVEEMTYDVVVSVEIEAASKEDIFG